MDVLHLRASRGFYGAERAVLDVASASARAGLVVGLAALVDEREPHVELAEAASEAGLEAWTLSGRTRLDLRPLRSLVSLLREQAPRVLHAHGYKALALGWLASRVTGTPLVVTRHGETAESPMVRLYESLARALLCQAGAVVAVSPREAEISCGSGAAERTHHIPNGIAAQAIAERVAAGRDRAQELARELGQPLLLAVGRLSPEKAHDVLLEAVASLRAPRPALAIAGDGPLRARLRERATQLGVRLHLPGYVRDLAPWWGAATLFCQPSLREGLPLAVLEAMAAGLPVVATRVGALSDLLGDPAPSGWLVDAADPSGLAGAIAEILSPASAGGVAERTERALKVLVERHSVDAVARRHIDEIYGPLLAPGEHLGPCRPHR